MYKMVDGNMVPLTDEEINEIEQRKAEAEQYEQQYGYIEKRKGAYPTLDDMVVALWEQIIENRPAASETLQIKRLEVKNLYPKP